MEDKDFDEAVEEIVNFFMRIVANRGPDDFFNLAMATFMNILAIIPYPIMSVAQDGTDFPPEYKNMVMELMPKFTVELRGHTAEFLQTLVQKSVDMGLVKDGEFEFLGHTYGGISDPPTDASN